MDGYQVAIHAIGDAANAEALDAIEELSADYTGDRRWRIEHAQIVDPADIPRFGQHGIIASMQPVHQTSDRLMAEARLGPGPARRRLCLALDPRRRRAARVRLGRAGRGARSVRRHGRRDQPRGRDGPAVRRLAAAARRVTARAGARRLHRRRRLCRLRRGPVRPAGAGRARRLPGARRRPAAGRPADLRAHPRARDLDRRGEGLRREPDARARAPDAPGR